MPSHRLSGPSDGSISSILVVDDDQDVVELLTILLEARGHHVHAFTSSVEALTYARIMRVDAAILDVNMPWPDGIELAHRLRSDPCTRRVRIAFHTSVPEDVVRTAFDSDALYLRKSVSGEAIVSSVEQLLTAGAGTSLLAPTAPVSM